MLCFKYSHIFSCFALVRQVGLTGSMRLSWTLSSSVSCSDRPVSWYARFLKQALVHRYVMVSCAWLCLVWCRAILLLPQLGNGLSEGIKILTSTLWKLTPISKRFNSNFFGVCTKKTLKMSHLSLPCSGNNKGDTFPTFLLLVL